MNDAKEIRIRLNDVREQALELEKEIQGHQQIAFSQHNEKEISEKDWIMCASRCLNLKRD